MARPLSNTFGRHDVGPDEREKRIREVFERVAPRYDLMNDLMSFGIHRLWKRDLARRAREGAAQTLVDLAGGTGDVARLLAGPGRTVAVCDPSLGMMHAGRSQRGSGGLIWVAATGESIPFADASIDVLTIAFGIRNVTHMDVALAEILRVLKPGGRFLCLEFSRPWALIRPFYNAFSYTVIPRLGAWVAQAPEAYHYLIESIRRFPDQEEMKALLQDAGFTQVTYCNLAFGIACIHKGHRRHAD
jgi:demethylmenaquinone methyltransferase/2-methoxy-6-polyprenyl-1,4-benzoquinol methylase